MSQEREAWERWVARHGPPALLYARQLTRSAADAEDALQDGFARFWRRRSNARDSIALLYVAVRSAAMDQRRSTHRRQRRETAAARKTPMFIASTADDIARQEVVERALHELPEEQREVVVLKNWSGLTFAEIAETVGAPINTVAARYRYALEKLSGLLTPETAMKDESIKAIEEQLARLEPAAMPGQLRKQLESIPDERLTLGDRALVACSGMGPALAAAVIVGVIIWQLVATPAPPRVTAQEMAARQRVTVEFDRLLAAK